VFSIIENPLETLKKYAMWDEILDKDNYNMKGLKPNLQSKMNKPLYLLSKVPCESGCAGCGGGDSCAAGCGCSTSCAG